MLPVLAAEDLLLMATSHKPEVKLPLIICIPLMKGPVLREERLRTPRTPLSIRNSRFSLISQTQVPV